MWLEKKYVNFVLSFFYLNTWCWRQRWWEGILHSAAVATAIKTIICTVTGSDAFKAAA